MRQIEASLAPPVGFSDLVRELASSEMAFPRDLALVAGEISVEGYLQELVDMAAGVNLQAGWVPMTTLWLLDAEERVVGVSRLRHRLTPFLLERGGHIGYFVRAAERGKGYGRAILALTLDAARRLGLERVLVTASIENVGSVRVIEANGGRLEDERLDDAGNPYGRYWIELTK